MTSHNWTQMQILKIIFKISQWKTLENAEYKFYSQNFSMGEVDFESKSIFQKLFENLIWKLKPYPAANAEKKNKTTLSLKDADLILREKMQSKIKTQNLSLWKWQRQKKMPLKNQNPYLVSHWSSLSLSLSLEIISEIVNERDRESRPAPNLVANDWTCNKQNHVPWLKIPS